MATRIEITLPPDPGLATLTERIGQRLIDDGRYLVHILDPAKGRLRVQVRAGGQPINLALSDAFIQDVQNRGGKIEFCD
jgi:hypothetical protein